MANKKVSQLTSKPSVLTTDLFPIADPSTGQLYKTTISDLGTAIGSGVSSVNGLVGAVVLDTDDIQELVSPTNKWFTDTRARAALSSSSPLTYNSGTGAFGIQVANGSQNGYLSSADWTTFNSKQAALSGTGFVKISGTTISYDNSTYLTTSVAASTYLALTGGTLTGALNGTSATFTGDLTISSTNPRIYLTDTDNNPDYFISNTDGTFTIYDVTNSTSKFTINGTTATLNANLTANQFRVGTPFDTSRSFGAAGNQHSIALWLEEYTSTGGGAPDIFFNNGRGTISSKANIQVGDALGGVTWAGYVNANFNGSVSLGASVINIDSTNNQANADFSISQSYNSVSQTENLRVYANGGGLYIRGNVQGASFVKAGGTSSQFLKADGSIDSNTYLTTGSASSTYLPLSGGTLTGALNGTSAIFSGNITGTSIVSVKGSTPFFRWLNASDTRLAYIQHNATNLVYNADTGIHIFNQAATFSSGITAAQLYTNSNAAASGFMQFNYATSNTSSRSWRLANDNVVYGDFAIQQSTTQTGATFTNLLYISPSGNVGINTTNPGTKFEVTGSAYISGNFRTYSIISDNQIKCSQYFETSPDQGTYNTWNIRMGAQAADACYYITAGGVNIMTTEGYNNPYTVKLYSNAIQTLQMTNGSLLINKTSLSASTVGVEFERNSSTRMTADANTVLLLNRLTSDGTIMDFRRSTTQVGSISVTTVMTSYNVTSDYRLKEDLKSINGLDIVNKINVYDYKWKSDNSRMNGVLAHELQEVLPYAVTGVKDGKEMQQVDYSKIVPVLIQSIKELKSKIETLENK